MASPAFPEDLMEMSEVHQTNKAQSQSSRRVSSKSGRGIRAAAAKIKAKAISSKRASKAQEKVEKRLQRALEKQVAKGAREAEKRRLPSP